ncbi:MAG TPA: phospholipid carrier-dependent glycosyltransferase [Candidatus Acidoferrales bacterium]|nr:phospholipid carrier-dependent glycosyltransferase [Candidatus Acidoferrales bacterium]
MVAYLQRRRDAVIATALGIASFILLFVRYWVPPGKIFDEVYFARAAEEYLERRYIYENTHPPVTKLLITLSVIMFGGLKHGDTSYGWRFLDVVAGAVAVAICFILAKRITRSTLFGAYAAVLFGLDGMHYVQSRIATPEAFVVCFSMLTLYAFCRYWDAVVEVPSRPIVPRAWLTRGLESLISLTIAMLVVAARWPHETLAAQIVLVVAIATSLYAAYRLWRARPAGVWWLLAFAFSGALLVASKWYGVMAYGVAFVVIAYASVRAWLARRASPFPIDVVAAAVIGSIGIVYALAYIPHFIGLRDLPNLAPRPYTVSDVVTMQYNAFMYHWDLRATHPYASAWWTWPLELRPLLYSANYAGTCPNCTAAMIYSMPNPLLLWSGLISVPLVGVLAVVQRNRGYGLVVLAYLLQWLPWMFSPRIAFLYHFYVNIPLIAICTAVAMQWLLAWMGKWDRTAARWIVAGYLVLVALAFVYFFPILSSIPISQTAWQQRLWLPSWHD